MILVGFFLSSGIIPEAGNSDPGVLPVEEF
jgi:hypothetical protein